MKRFLLWVLTCLLVLGSAPSVLALEKLKLGTAVRVVPLYYLTIFAGEEKGIWKENGLDVEWVPFRSGADLTRAMTAGAVMIGMGSTPEAIVSISRGLPLVIVSAFRPSPEFSLWVKGDSPIREPKDLKGKKLGISRLGVPSHLYGQMIAKNLGLEKDIRFVAAGGVTEIVAGMKAGHIDGTVQPDYVFIDLQLKGEVRELMRFAAYLPKEWAEGSVNAHREFVKKRPDIMKKTVKAILQALNYAKKDPNWAIEKIKVETGFSDRAARLVFERLQIIDDGKISPKSLENLINFLVEYGQLSKDKVPPIDQIYTAEFVD